MVPALPAELDRMVNHFGGLAKCSRVLKQIGAWGRANLPADIYEMAATSLDGVLAMHRAMLAAAKGGER